MAISKSAIAFIFLMISLLLLQVVHSDEITMSSGRSLLQKIDCGAKCAERCKLSGRPNLCHRACGTCCGRCNCVPPGTYGNYDVCPCYANLTTTGGKKKCP
ncbi:gibberellin-regulated protein 1-like [Heracleum sosnowskyi]|uniref:Gibberellin-regulated protein 1-like n=1 Tax=Heracleum sosnowskyi TaxID=360622 RepID=A0AAD8HA49_9APIA|nr:gibberellin-regulated protein 1-like [Heracleum sosnowskyi]